VRPVTTFSRCLPVWLITGVLLAAAAGAALGQGPGTAAPTEGEIKREETPKMSILELLLKGGWFMVPIGLCSLMGLAIIIERLIALRRGAIIPPRFMEGLKSAFRGDRQDRAAGLEYCGENDCPMGRVAAAGIRKMRRGETAVERAIEDAGANEIGLLRRNLRMLYGVAAVAPMLGLLGTVWGMIQAFQVASEAGLGRAEKLATGIYEALVTTFGGLIVAIPALIFYYYFLSKIDRIVYEMNETSVELVEHYLGQEAASAPPAPVPAAVPAGEARPC